MLCRYVAFLAEDGLAHSTIKSYLSAVRQLQIAEGLPDPFLASMPRLEQVIKGIKVRQGKQGRKPRKKLPITPAILHKMRLAWETEADDPDLIMLWAACTLCFFGFLCSGEIAIPAENAFDPTYHLAFEDLAVDSRDQPSYMQVSLKGSKTDPFRHGVKITAGRTRNKLSPVAAMLAYAAVRGAGKSPLFRFKNGKPLTRPSFVSKVRDVLARIGFPAESYAGHSFRVGQLRQLVWPESKIPSSRHSVGGRVRHISCTLEFRRSS